jgi:DNA-binding LacI/PurR family transcriptional regulator
VPTGRAPTRHRQSDIALAAGVSQATVSMVLNGRTGKGATISADTRDRVLRAAADLGYVANPAARSLAGGRNNLLGVFTFESVFPAESADFYHPFLVGVEREAEAQGYDLVLFTSSAGTDGRRRIYRDNANRLRMSDGCVLLGYEEDRAELDRLAAEDFPFVFIGRREVPGQEITYVAADYAGATCEAVSGLAELGHRRVAYLGRGHPDHEPTVDREAGFERARVRHGLDPDPRLRVAMPSGELPAAALEELLASGVTAFATEDDAILRGLLDFAVATGRQPPDDFSVVALVDPTPQPLPVLRQQGSGQLEVSGLRVPRLEMGAAAVRLLDELLRGPVDAPARQVVLSCRVVAGTTTGPVPQPSKGHS